MLKRSASVKLHELCGVVNKLVWSMYVDDIKHQRSLYQSTTAPKRTERNLFVHISKF